VTRCPPGEKAVGNDVANGPDQTTRKGDAPTPMSDAAMDNDPRERIYEEARPWGAFRQYTHNEVSTVKIITVGPGEVLSLQRHRKRDELWVALTEGLEVTLGERVFRPQLFQEMFVPRETKHRMAGVGDAPARWLEVSFGVFEEDDIERFDDAYGRT
jgi:mannose-6-phosphate isomerase